MSLQLILESAKEVRRLAIAGSPLAIGDFRLKKLIPPLEQAGAKVPVFGQVARAIGELVNGKEADSASNLLSLGTLLNAILYTQGQTGVTGDLREIDAPSASDAGTGTPYRTLRPLIAALTSTGSGRFETVKAAVERGAFNDMRLIEPAIHALGDPYPELAELVAEKVLPGFGPGIVPRLKAGFDIAGKRQDGRRLLVMHRLDPAGTLELCKRALDEGSAAVKESAIACLGSHVECVPLLIGQLKTRNETLRAAVLEALARNDHPEAVNVLRGIIRSDSSLAILAAPFLRLRSNRVMLDMVEEGARLLRLIAGGDSSHLGRFREVLDCFGSRNEPEVEAFLISCLDNPSTIAALDAIRTPSALRESLPAIVATQLYRRRTPKACEAILTHWKSLPPDAFPMVLRSAVQSWAPGAVFDAFSPLLAKGTSDDEDRREALEDFVFADTCASPPPKAAVFSPITAMETGDELHALPQNIQWDERWLDAAIRADRRTLVCSLARPNHPGAVAYLLKLANSKKASESGLLIRALARSRYPQVTEFFLGLVEKKCKAAKYYDYELQTLFEAARHLPTADLPKLDAFAQKLDETFADRFLEAIAPLRPANTPI